MNTQVNETVEAVGELYSKQLNSNLKNNISILNTVEQKNKESETKGITLIALVVTIVVLLILAAITINLLIADDGLFHKAQQSELEQRKAEVLDQLYGAEAAVSVEYLGKPTIENFLEQIYTEQIVVEEDTEDLGNGAYNVCTEDGLVFTVSAIIGTNVNDIVYEYVGEAGNLPPTIRITNTTTNSVSIEVLRAEGVSEFKYSYKLHTEESYTVAQESSSSNTYNYTGLTSNTIYDLQVEFTKDGEPVTITKSVLIGEIPSGAIKLKEVTWSNGTATAVIYTEEDGYQMEWQVGAIEEGSWSRAGEGVKEVSIPNVQNGQIIYARLYDGVSSGREANFDIRDEIEPQAEIILSGNTAEINGTTTATVTLTDNESGVNTANSKWVYNTTAGEIGTDASLYTGGTFTNTTEELNLTATEGGTYYLHVLATDHAGNAKEYISQGIEVTNIPEYWETTTAEDPNWYDYGTEVNAPVLGEGMTPIVYTGSNVPTEKKWANAITADGSMWVWIPRYAYQIESGYHSSTAGTINIKFLKGTTDVAYDGKSEWDNASGEGNWNIHPAFYYFEDNRAVSRNMGSKV